MCKVKFKEIATITAGQAAPKEFSNNGLPFIRAGHLEELVSGSELNKIPKINNEIAKKYKLKKLPKGSILFAKSGMSAKKNRIYISSEDSYFVSHLAAILPSENFNTNYLARYLNWFNPTNLILDDAYPSIRLEDIKELEILLPTLSDQQKIANILDKADELRQYNKQLVEKYDALTQSLFLDMFGDPLNNEKKWEKKKLGELGSFKNGLNYTKSENGKVVKILGVGDFKDFWKISNYSNLSTIEIESFPSPDFLLKNGDLIFVRSNGNKDLVGRCLITYPNEEKVTYSGFCIRFRKSSLYLSDMYLVQLMRNKLFKKYIFKNGRGANIQNINQELLSKIEIQLPPINLQNKFAEFILQIETQKQQAQEALEKSEALFQSLLQKAFKGELS
ncbi:restriction endonuclease subunit S [Flavobacterium sp. ov086]|uniref:restriction endonuclease subunit S n=1 Tax=Flavobacterium sp. ov086 TaxID=1761785 RepID=UPI000B660A57|nr:restriction endonuclease subunit S [Flavobacterium sp. ov086]SNR33120.1 type I restriction enzyme, S subunit [Flavobacterium sp. ov086]